MDKDRRERGGEGGAEGEIGIERRDGKVGERLGGRGEVREMG